MDVEYSYLINRRVDVYLAMFKQIVKALISDVGTKNDVVRERWVKTAIEKLPGGSRLLDAGAGQQRYRSYSSHLRYVSQDFCQYDGKGPDRALHSVNWDTSRIDIVSDIADIPEPDDSFDAILCTEVLEHVPDPVAAITEFHRLLRPGGELIMSAPFCSLTHMAPYHYYSGFNKYFFSHFLPLIGFELVEMTPNGSYNEFLAQELRRLPSMYPRLPLLVGISFRILLRFLGKTRNSANDSSDLLCFGYHIRAVKKGNA